MDSKHTFSEGGLLTTWLTLSDATIQSNFNPCRNAHIVFWWRHAQRRWRQHYTCTWRHSPLYPWGRFVYVYRTVIHTIQGWPPILKWPLSFISHIAVTPKCPQWTKLRMTRWCLYENYLLFGNYVFSVGIKAIEKSNWYICCEYLSLEILLRTTGGVGKGGGEGGGSSGFLKNPIWNDIPPPPLKNSFLRPCIGPKLGGNENCIYWKKKKKGALKPLLFVQPVLGYIRWYLMFNCQCHIV